MEVAGLGVVAKVHPVPAVSDDVLCPGVLIRTLLHQHAQPTNRHPVMSYS